MGDLPEIITDEAMVPAYRLPDPLVSSKGEIILHVDQWSFRRAQILTHFENCMYGQTPADSSIQTDMIEQSACVDVFNGRGLRREVRLGFRRGDKESHLDILLYYPGHHNGPAPFFVGLNFCGNHSVQPDPDIRLSDAWFREREDGVKGNRANEAARGIEASRWPVERILSRGYGLVTAYYGDLDPDYDDGFKNGIQPLFYQAGQECPAEDEWGAIGAWAWGLSRIMDFLEDDENVDSERVAVMGHSRLGKAALWAGAQDTRFQMVVSNNSGCGGAALSRRRFGETVQAINLTFPHWFCKNFHQFNNREDDLPIDQHMLISLIAPRPVYIASAEEDLWADPRGEFLSAYHAAPVYRLLGTDGLAADNLPDVEDPILSRIGYHLRRGPHDVTSYDWDCFMDFADLHL